MGFSGGSDGEESACDPEDLGLIPKLGRSSGEWNGNSLQDSCLENSIERGAWRTTVPGVTKSETEQRNCHFYCYNMKTGI